MDMDESFGWDVLAEGSPFLLTQSSGSAHTRSRSASAGKPRRRSSSGGGGGGGGSGAFAAASTAVADLSNSGITYDEDEAPASPALLAKTIFETQWSRKISGKQEVLVSRERGRVPLVLVEPSTRVQPIPHEVAAAAYVQQPFPRPRLCVSSCRLRFARLLYMHIT